MLSIFGQTFLSVSEGLLVIFFIAGISAILTYKGIINQETIDGFSKLVVRVFLPFLIFYTVTKEFDPSTQVYWWKIPLAAIALSSLGLLFSYLLFIKTAGKKKSYFPLASMQNAAYLILPLGELVYPDQFDEFSLICFLVVLGLSPFMWTVGKFLLTTDRRKGPGLKKLITPPFVANVLSIVLVLTGISKYVPHIITETASFVGKATVPVATFILGATLVISISSIPPFWDSFRILTVKFLLLPIITIIALKLTHTSENFPLLADVLIIQSASAPATAHILQIRTYGGDLKKAGGMIFLSYIVCLIAIPGWLAVWKIL
jgi:malate permease and related proteins